MTKNRILSVAIALIGCFLSLNATQFHKMATSISPKIYPGVPILDNPIYDPEGTDEACIMNVTENSYWGEEDVDGYKVTVRRSADGKKIYFYNLTPGYNGDSNTEGYTWVEGNLNGNDITIPAGQVLYKGISQTLHLEVVTFDSYGQVTGFQSDIHFTIDGEKILQTDNDVRIGVFEDGETADEIGFFIFMNNFEIMPMGDITTFAPPADAEIERWMLVSDSSSRFVKVARDGDQVYIAGLSTMAPDDYVVGTLDNGQLIFRSGYILCSNPMRYVRLIGARPSGQDEFGYPQLEMTSGYVFDVNEAENSFTLTPSDDYIVEASYFNFNMFNGITNVELHRYTNDVAATPATPEILLVSEADAVIQVSVPCYDVDGNFINPEKLTYRIYLDGKPHLFTPDKYTFLTESMTDIPYDFTDQYDIYSNGSTKTIYLHAPAFKSVGVESRYTVDGDTRVSEQGVYSGIQNVETDHGDIISRTYSDILGRTVQHPAPGSFLIQTTVYADGTRSVTKLMTR